MPPTRRLPACRVRRRWRIASINLGAPEKGGSDFGAKGYNSFWLSTGDNLARVKGEYRTSNIVDPPNGQIPHKDPAAVMAKAREAGIKYMTGVGT